jgi:hypothetical protein
MSEREEGVQQKRDETASLFSIACERERETEEKKEKKNSRSLSLFPLFLSFQNLLC